MFTVKLKHIVSCEKSVMHLKGIVEPKWIFCMAWVSVCMVWLKVVPKCKSVCVREYVFLAKLELGFGMFFVRSVEMSIEPEMWKRIRTMVMWLYQHVLIVSPCSSQTDRLITLTITSLTLLNKHIGLSKPPFYWFCQITSAKNIYILHMKQPKKVPLSHIITWMYFSIARTFV